MQGGRRSRCFPFGEWAVDARACRVSFAPRGQGHGGRGGPRCPSSARGGATACIGDNGATNFAETNLARRQPVTPAPAVWGFCHGSRFAQKYCLRFAFAFTFTNDSDMEPGNGRVPESGVASPI